jgi:hypothetical protein
MPGPPLKVSEFRPSAAAVAKPIAQITGRSRTVVSARMVKRATHESSVSGQSAAGIAAPT